MRIIPEISPRYFFSNPRFRSLGQITFPKLIDYMHIYEEGSLWTLTIIEVTIDNNIQYLFLPLTADRSPANRDSNYRKPAFGIETNSSFYGKRQWEVFDAFADFYFHNKLIDLFLPSGGLSKDHVNPYIDIKVSDIGKFEFITKYELSEQIYLEKCEEMELIETGLILKFAEYSLKIYQTLPALNDAYNLEKNENVAGWIKYSGEHGLHLLIGTLQRLKDDHL